MRHDEECGLVVTSLAICIEMWKLGENILLLEASRKVVDAPDRACAMCEHGRGRAPNHQREGKLEGGCKRNWL
jgi:hypothetical protein